MTAAETGLLLLCCALPEAEDRPLTMAQFQELAKRARALGPGGEDPLRELTEHDLARLGYAQGQCARIVRLLSRNTQLERYLRAAEQHGIVPITRLSPRYPARLRQTLGQRCPAVLFAKGDLALLSACCISVVGSRELTECGRAFAEAAGRLIARSDYTLCSGGAAGADRAAQAACLKNGGSAVIFPVGRLLDCPAPANVLYLADQGYDLPFSAQRRWQGTILSTRWAKKRSLHSAVPEPAAHGTERRRIYGTAGVLCLSTATAPRARRL